MLMSSTPLAYPQVVSRRLTSFRVANFCVSAAHGDFRGGFDSRQLHKEGPDLEQQVRAFSLSMG